MKIIVTPRRHAVPLAPGAPEPTAEERSAAVAELRRKAVAGLARLFPQARIIGIQARGELLLELPDSEPDLPSRIRAALDVETGPAPGAGPPMPVWRADLPPVHETVQAMYLAGDYRPTVLACVRREDGSILLVQSMRNGEWGFVQGGVEEGESPVVALFRELREEIGAGGRRVRHRPPAFLGCADIDAEPGSADHMRFTRGVRYFAYAVAYRGPERLALQGSELSGFAWVAPRLDDGRLLELLAGGRPQKTRLILSTLVRILA